MRCEVETEPKTQKEKSRGQCNNLKVCLEAEKSVPGVGTSNQGVGKLNTGNSKCIYEGVEVMGSGLNSMMEWSGEYEILLEKKSKRGSCLTGS